MNNNKLLSMAVIALLACGSADAQSILGRLANRAKNAAENAIGNKIENAVYNAVDKSLSTEPESVSDKRRQKQQASEQTAPATDPAKRVMTEQSAPVRNVATEPVAAQPAATKKAPVQITDPMPGAVAFKFTNGVHNEGLYTIYTRAEGQARSDTFDEGMNLDENEAWVKYSTHDVMLSPRRGETPMKYENSSWKESYSAAQEVAFIWSGRLKDRSDFYVQNDGFREDGTAVVCGRTCRKFVGTIKTMGGYDLFLLNGASAEIYTWNGYTMRLVLNGKVIHEVVGYTDRVPEAAFTQTLDVNWL